MHRFIFAVLLATFITSLAAQPGRAADRPPNVILVLADDIGAKELACYGNTEHKTPNLDRMANEGMRFSTCWVTPLCSPTRVALMTGRYGFRTGWNALIDRPYSPKRGDPQYDVGTAQVTFADLAKSRGYATALAGKWQLSGQVPTIIHDCGFDEYLMWAYTWNLPAGVKHTGAFQKGGSTTSRYWHPSLMLNGQYRPTTPDDYGPDLFNQFVIDFATKNKEKPFFIYYTQPLTHDPHVETPDPNNPGKRWPDGFKSSVEYLDHLMGQLNKSIDDAGLRDNTYIIFVGDNGTGKKGKGTTTEAGVRVPLIVRGPGVKAGVVSDALVDVSDFFATIAELTGAAMPTDRTIDGMSFTVLRGEKPTVRDWSFSFFRDERMLRDDRFILEGSGKLLDCGTHRDGEGYKEVTNSNDPDVVAVKAKFVKLLEKLPAPPHEDKPASRPAEE